MEKNEKDKVIIELYEQNELLWNVTHNDYHNRMKRDTALRKIGNKIGISGTYILWA